MAIRNLIKNQSDPSLYTYAELLKFGQELMYDNKEAKALRNIYTLDQDLRNKTKQLEQEFGVNSQEVKDHWISIGRQDSLNLLKVKSILDKKGWLEPTEVSEEGNSAIFLVIQHADKETQEKYLPMMRSAVKEGKARGQDLALLEDRLALAQGEKQIYGSQIRRNADTGIYYVAPLRNPQQVNERRNSVGLGPIENYVMIWDINWATEVDKLITQE